MCGGKEDRTATKLAGHDRIDCGHSSYDIGILNEEWRGSTAIKVCIDERCNLIGVLEMLKSEAHSHRANW